MRLVWNARTRLEAAHALLRVLDIDPERDVLVVYALRFPLGLAFSSALYTASFALNGYLLAGRYVFLSVVLAVGTFVALVASARAVALVLVPDERICVTRVTLMGLALRSVVLDAHPFSVRLTRHPTLTGASFRLETERSTWTLHSAGRARPLVDSLVELTTPTA